MNGIGLALAIGIASRIIDPHLIETGRKRGDSVQMLENCTMFETRDAGRHENPEMSDMRIDEIDDPLAGALQVLGAAVDSRDPPKRLMGWGDVVSPRGKNDHWITDAAQIGKAALAHPQQALFELVADEEIFDDGEHFFTTQEVEAVPPAFEFKKPVALLIDLSEQVRIFFPNRLRLQVLEVLYKPRTIEPAIAEIGSKMREPCPAQ